MGLLKEAKDKYFKTLPEEEAPSRDTAGAEPARRVVEPVSTVTPRPRSTVDTEVDDVETKVGYWSMTHKL